MPTVRDHHDLVLSTNAAAAEAFGRMTFSYLMNRADVALHLSAALAADPEFMLAHCAKGYFALLSFKQANEAVAAESMVNARRLEAGATPRERMHVDALDAWLRRDPHAAVAIWESILVDAPTDPLALRLAHFNNFWLGRPRAMLASVERALPAWRRAHPGYGVALGCRAFALEECGAYTEAERVGREAVGIDPADLWSVHAVAHVLEMQGRHAEGIAWLEGLQSHWAQGSNLVHHLWWHRAMYHLERGEHDVVLDLYDRRIRDLAAPLTVANPDLYIDVQNAAAMLYRLQRTGADVGSRWEEIADKAESRIGDCRSAFTLPHWMLALAATGRHHSARRMLEGMREYEGDGRGFVKIIRELAVPVCAAILDRAEGQPRRAVDRMRPVLGSMHALGGSHAQQDVLWQFFHDAAIDAGSADDMRLARAHAAAARPVPIERQVGYRKAA